MGVMKADFLTYPLPGAVSFSELVNNSISHGLDLVVIAGYIGHDDVNPDLRFRMYVEEAINVCPSLGFGVRLFPWSEDDDTIVLFKVFDDVGELTFLRGDNGSVRITVGNKTRYVDLLRLGNRFPYEPGMDLDGAVEKAEGAITLVSSDLFSEEGNNNKDIRERELKYLERVDGIYYQGEINPLRKSRQDRSFNIANSGGRNLVTVSGSHVPYFGTRLGGFGSKRRSFIELGLEGILVSYGREYINVLKDLIVNRKISCNMRYSDLLHLGLAGVCMGFRKFLKGRGFERFDYVWKEGEPIVKLSDLKS